MQSKSFNRISRIAFCLAVLAVLSLVIAACSRQKNQQSAVPATSSTETAKASPNEGPPADVVTASASPVEMSAGSSAEALVTVKIATGFHINSNPSSNKYQIATALDVESSGGVTAGKVTYPPFVSKKFSFSPDPIMVYEGDVVIKQPLRADQTAAKGNRTLVAKLRVQPCDETVCYSPRTLGVSIPVNIK